jgi:hypothetical protein
MDFMKKLNSTAKEYEQASKPKKPKDPIGGEKDVSDFERGFNAGGSVSDGWKNIKKTLGIK